MNNNKKSETSQEQPTAALSASEAKYVEDILKDAEKNVDKEVVLKGFIHIPASIPDAVAL